MNSTGGSVTYLQRPSENLEDGLLAEVHTVKGKRTTLFTAMLLEGIQIQDDDQGVDASKFLYRKGRFDASYDVIVQPGFCSDFRPGSRSYYFVGNDGAEYRWKYQKSFGWTVSTLPCLCRVQINVKPSYRYVIQEMRLPSRFGGSRKKAYLLARNDLPYASILA